MEVTSEQIASCGFCCAGLGARKNRWRPRCWHGGMQSRAAALELRPEPTLVSGRLKTSLPRDHVKAHEPAAFLLSLILPVPQRAHWGWAAPHDTPRAAVSPLPFPTSPAPAPGRGCSTSCSSPAPRSQPGVFHPQPPGTGRGLLADSRVMCLAPGPQTQDQDLTTALCTGAKPALAIRPWPNLTLAPVVPVVAWKLPLAAGNWDPVSLVEML